MSTESITYNSEEVTAEQFHEAVKTIRSYKAQLQKQIEDAEYALKEVPVASHLNPETMLCDAGLSVRLFLALRDKAQFPKLKITHKTKLKELSNISISEFKRVRNVGKKSVQELKEICYYAGVELQP